MRRMAREAVICDGGLPALVAIAHAAERWHLERGSEPNQKPIVIGVCGAFEGAADPARVQADLFSLDYAALGSKTGVVRLVVEASLEASAQGAGVLTWPVCLGEGSSAEEPLDRISQATDLALLASRLVSLEAGGVGLVVETPLVDLTDRQVAELALDIDAPIETCAWWGRENDPEHARWTRVLSALGWRRPRPLHAGGTR